MLANQAEHGDHAGIAAAAATMAHAKQAVVNCVLVPLQQIAKDSLDKMDENIVFPNYTTIAATALQDWAIVCRGIVDGMLANPAAVTRHEYHHMRALFEEIFPHVINVSIQPSIERGLANGHGCAEHRDSSASCPLSRLAIPAWSIASPMRVACSRSRTHAVKLHRRHSVAHRDAPRYSSAVARLLPLHLSVRRADHRTVRSSNFVS
ncbi:hypothetical protein HPB52_020793 [Rhipicephalus sanguineus]|uniref:Uncharacterized protein n=1 Tax=Rhipicephalus sanguineus TaxID=34632 RepID=A0A9D4PQG3_RHISA|nr:hypothetical protein HPB52_020793 [Rhipicephalus sanguineus]